MDQVAALHWIQENIREFGGDERNVTIMGYGHGAACVNFLMLSPMARGTGQRPLSCYRLLTGTVSISIRFVSPSHHAKWIRTVALGHRFRRNCAREECGQCTRLWGTVQHERSAGMLTT